MLGAGRTGIVVLALVGPVLAGGCGGSGDPKTKQLESELKDVHEIYLYYIKNEQKGPTKLADLVTAESAQIFPAAANALKGGKYLMVWGVNSKDSGTLLAYEKEVPTQGGTVLMADGSLRTMSAEEFKAAKKP
jgi:hypothetical protein